MYHYAQVIQLCQKAPEQGSLPYSNNGPGGLGGYLSLALQNGRLRQESSPMHVRPPDRKTKSINKSCTYFHEVLSIPSHIKLNSDGESPYRDV